MKTAIFYDLENIGLSTKSDKFEENFLSVLDKIKQSSLVGQIILQKAYMRKMPHSEEYKNILAKHNVELFAVEAPLIRQPSKTANMVDFKMGIDTTAAIFRKRSIETVVIASGDNDFGFLCQQVKDMGKKLLVVSHFLLTGGAILQICDDWIDLTPKPIQPKQIQKIIDTRLTKNYKDYDFIDAFTHFMSSLIDDPFIRRYMSNYGIPASLLMTMAQNRSIKFPSFYNLGYSSITPLLAALLHGSQFEYKSGSFFYTQNDAPITQDALIEKTIRPPYDYSTKKLMHYHDTLSQIENIDELSAYIALMRRLGMLQNNKLCYKPTFRSTIRKHLQDILQKSGITPNNNDIKKFSQRL